MFKKSRFQLVLSFYLLWMGVFLATRLTLLILTGQNTDLSPSALLQVFATGALFDSAFLSYAMVLPVIYIALLPRRIWAHPWHSRFIKLVSFTAIYLTGFIAVAEYLFWIEFGVRFNFIAIDYLIYRREVTENILQSYPVPLILVSLLLIAFAIFQLLLPTLNRSQRSEDPFFRRVFVATILLGLPVLAYFGITQDYRHISRNNFTNELASNGPYQFVAAFRNNELDYWQFYANLPNSEASRLLRHELDEEGVHFLGDTTMDIMREVHNSGPERKLNVVLVTVESLSSDFLKYFGNDRGLTPNLDALIEKSLFFDNFYATGTRTTRGLEAITLSIPPTPGRSIIKRIGRETDMWSLGNILNDKGYHSYFLYGGRGFFENMNSFFSGNGYRIVDQSNTPDQEIHFSNAWGMADEDLYQQAIRVADLESAQHTPFFLHLMTTSNHRPYTYPDGRIDIPSGSGREGAVKYTDYAIGEFLKEASTKGWFEDTVFVIVADHQAGSAGKHDLPVARYHIPLWIYSPQNIAPRVVTTLSSQIDLAPTLLGLLNMNYVSSFFGKDILRNPPNRALIANYQNLGLYDGNELAILEPQKKIYIQSGPGDDLISEKRADLKSDLVRRDISYYQGAAYIYHNRLNAWSRREEPNIKVALNKAKTSY
ncbi:MAG: LTA synthase family protein [Geothermobacteraceae bacterium]